jgi:hypothetical protein
MTRLSSRIAAAAAVTLGFTLVSLPLQAQGQATPPAQAQGAPGGRANTPPPDPTKPHRLEITTGTTARYKVREQLAGINFPSDAVGTTSAVTGAIVVKPDGSIDAAQSKITVEL